ncbi:DUF262 domain-containing protein [Tenacibaculum sp.]|uniref:DUF262 domain-containing protein n=1 Tax=Tenacibaculum sp. TaxID=1906242 RepID=UPI003AA9D0D6
MEKKLTNDLEIKSSKLKLGEIFDRFWFNIPEYQRPYVWGEEQIDLLFDDLIYSRENNFGREYFLGALVLQKHRSKISNEFDEFDVLDGQQRLTTIFLILLIIKNISDDSDTISACQGAVYQKGNKIKNIPERLRIIFKIRDEVQSFINDIYKEKLNESKIKDLKTKILSPNQTISNLSKAIIHIYDRVLKIKEDEELDNFTNFLFTQVVIIYVSTTELEDAFHMFTTLNSRGVPLNYSDILKSMNMGAIEREKLETYSRIWEDMEEYFGNDFDKFLSYIRTILLKKKASSSILKEYEKLIYGKNIVEKGIKSVKLFENYKGHYDKIICLNELPNNLNPKFNQLITIMKKGFRSDEWISALLYYFDKFRYENLFEFTTLLDKKVSSDWIIGLYPNNRQTNIYKIITAIEQANKPSEIILNNSLFNVNIKKLIDKLNSDIYSSYFTRYVLLKLEYLDWQKTDEPLKDIKYISIEHVLPRNPKPDSKWTNIFNLNDRIALQNKLGNLILLSRAKNSSLGNSDFARKKEKYFGKHMGIFPNSSLVMRKEEWTPSVIRKRQNFLLNKIEKTYKN